MFPPLGRAADVRRAEGILIGHGHVDHMSDAATVAARTGARLVGAAVTTEKLAAQSVPIAQLVTATGRGGKFFQFGAFTIEPILGRHGEPALEVLRAFQAALDATSPKRTADEIAKGQG